MAKRMSRRDRCSEAASNFESAANDLRDIVSEMGEELEKYGDACDDQEVPEALIDGWRDRLKAIEVGMDEFEELKGEMENWRDNTPENLQGTDKYGEMSDCCDALDNLTSMEFEIPQIDEGVVTVLSLKSLVETLEEAADNMDQIADEANGIDFPGMR